MFFRCSKIYPSLLFELDINLASSFVLVLLYPLLYLDVLLVHVVLFVPCRKPAFDHLLSSGVSQCSQPYIGRMSQYSQYTMRW